MFIGSYAYMAITGDNTYILHLRTSYLTKENCVQDRGEEKIFLKKRHSVWLQHIR